MVYEDDPEGPPCGGCLPEIPEDDLEIIRVFEQCKTQVIAGAGGVIDLNDLAVAWWMEKLGISDQLRCMKGVKAMHAAYTKALEEKYKDAKDFSMPFDIQRLAYGGFEVVVEG